MSDLTAFALHARAMSTAEHKPTCEGLVVPKYHREWPRIVSPDPDCDGCVTDDDRALWTRLADEADAWLSRHDEDALDFEEGTT